MNCPEKTGFDEKSKIQPGDLVMRKYEIKMWGINLIGHVVERDGNGFLSVQWGTKLEHMWDEYDLEQLK